MNDDWKPVKIFIPPVPLTEEQLEPQVKQFEGWAGSIEGEPTKENVKKLFIDGYQAGRERGFEEGYAKGSKTAADHFTFSRKHRPAPTDLKGEEMVNADLLSHELNEVISQAAILPNEVKIDALFSALESRFGVKIDRNRDGR